MSAFEADRFNHSRTSPRGKLTITAGSALDKLHKTEWKLPTLQSPNACQDGNSPLLAAAFPALAEERLQKFCAPACQHSPPHLHPVIRLRVIYHLHDGVNGTRLGVVGAIHQAFHAGVY